MQFVHNWLIKSPYALCKSCRGMPDLQLSYSNFCALQFKFLEKNPGQSRQAELDLTLGTPEQRPRRRSRLGRVPAPLGPHAEAGLGLPVRTLWDPLAPHRLPPPLTWPHASRAHRPVAPSRRQHRPPSGVAAVLHPCAPPCCAPCRDRVVLDLGTASLHCTESCL
jgi:hypothetical protein